jgi:hypothetical protein
MFSGEYFQRKTVEKRKFQLLRTLWEGAKMLLSPEELNNELLLSKTNCSNSAWHVAAFMDSSGVFEQLCGWAKEPLKTDELNNNNNILLAKDERKRTVLHQATLLGNTQMLERL